MKLGGAEVGGTQIDNLEYSLSQSCNCAMLPTDREGQQTSIPIFSNFLQQQLAVGGEQMDQQWDSALAHCR